MSNAVPSKPPVRPFRPAYALTTTARVPGRPAASTLTDPVAPSPSASPDSDGALA
jgi:hypothetical protein